MNWLEALIVGFVLGVLCTLAFIWWDVKDIRDMWSKRR